MELVIYGQARCSFPARIGYTGGIDDLYWSRRRDRFAAQVRMSETDISVVSSKELVTLFGACDQHVRRIREALSVSISARDGRIHVQGEEQAVASATQVLEELQAHAQRHGELAAEDINRVLAGVQNGETAVARPAARPLTVFTTGRQIRARSQGQAHYIDAIAEHDVVLCYGPAGTGKTYLAVAAAVAALRAERVRKLVLVRPAVEAGESLGFLPGDLQAKINPVPASADGRLARNDGPRADQPLPRARPDRGHSAGLHAGPHVERGIHHSRRSAEHDRFADEDVPHAHGPRFEDRGFRRHDADRSAGTPQERPGRRLGSPARHRRRGLRETRPRRYRSPPAGAEDRQRL